MSVPLLSPAEMSFIQRLAALSPLETTVPSERERVEKACRRIGREIFATYKQAAGRNSAAGIGAMYKICSAIRFLVDDGMVRSQYIDHAWRGVGDRRQQWLFKAS
jgi:hypothetical protein